MDSARATAPIRIRSQSASVLGRFSTIPCCLLTTILTALNSGSAAGTITSCISSFTDTIGLRSPHNAAFSDGAAALLDAGAAGGFVFVGEHADVPATARHAAER